jgi:hypothetical protein
VTVTQGEASDNRIMATALVTFVVAVGTIVAWCMWQHRAHANVRALGAEELMFTPGWAVGWWFIPLANVVQPVRAVRELWKASDPTAGAVDWKSKPSTPLLPAWWTGWLLRVYVFPSLAFSAVANKPHPLAAELIVRDRYLLAGDAVTLITAVLAIMLVRRVTERLAAKRERVSEWTRSYGQTA